MTSDQAEIPLMGGRVTPGVVRVGNTVRKPATTNSGLVHRLLRHLAERGFDGAPDTLGTDERGRDVFTFIDGDVPAKSIVPMIKEYRGKSIEGHWY